MLDTNVLGTKSGVRTMGLEDLGLVLDWADAEGWNPGVRDAEPFFAADPNGFLVAEQDDQPIGSISVVAYDRAFGFLGLFLVRPEFRGQGHGRTLFGAGLDYLADRTVGLDGVVAQQEYYGRHGFEFAYRTRRHEGVSRPTPDGAAPSAGELVDLSTLPLDELTAYDAQVFPAARPAFLEAWIRQPGTIALGLTRSGRLVGFGVSRPCRVGYKIGPLFADDAAAASALFDGLLATTPGGTVYLDVPEPNTAAAELAQRHGMKPIFETARMYRGAPPAVDLTRTFGVTTLELG